jgi:hypothetical protein
VPEVDWSGLGVDPLTGIDCTEAGEDLTEVWRYHHHWLLTGAKPPARPRSSDEAEQLVAQLHAKHDEGEPLRIGAAYRLASLGDRARALSLLAEALHDDRENVRRAATYGLIAFGPEATDTLVAETRTAPRWVRRAAVYALGDTAPLTAAVLEAVGERLERDPSVAVRAVAAGTLGCLGRRSLATGDGVELLPACVDVLLGGLAREENRLCMAIAQGRSIYFVRPTDDCDLCEGAGVDYGLDRFEPVRSAVRESLLWSLVMLCSHGGDALGGAFAPTVEALRHVIRDDPNVVSVGYAMDALARLAVGTGDRPDEQLLSALEGSPLYNWESLCRAGLDRAALSRLDTGAGT